MTFDEFVESRLSALLRFAKVLCIDRPQAEDVVQSVLLRAMERWPSIETMDNPQAYVRKMIVNEFLSWRRSKWANVLPASAILDYAVVTGDPADDVLTRDQLVAEIRRLPRQQRAVVVLRYYGDLTDEEIGAEINCSAATVRSHASRALRMLRIEVTTAFAEGMEV